MRTKFGISLMLTFGVAMAAPAHWPSVDAPELAAYGPHAVGTRTLVLVQHEQIDPRRLDPKTGTAPVADYPITVDLWYPAAPARHGKPAVYAAEMSGEHPGEWTHYETTGIATRDAKATPGKWPLVVVSHGLSNATALMAWLTENLASKGYVVAAIRHNDPAYTDPTRALVALARRPLDIAFVATTLQDRLGHDGLVDPSRTALIGYSIGTYGALTAAGATLDPAGPLMSFIPGGLMKPYARGGALRETLRVRNVLAVVAIAPVGLAPVPAWDATGLAELTTPLFMIAGNRDNVVSYTGNARQLLERATGSHRYLLTYLEGSHNLALGPTTDAMRQKLWDFDWVEGPVWRQERVFGINLHMITAFLDLYVKGDSSSAAYLDVAAPNSDDGVWPPPAPARWDALSPGGSEITIWKGFQRNRAVGLELLQRAAGSP
jgi:predicted dienelactone hydrolase